ncbi:MAG: PEGA domain-containing protein, partial [Candidatus Eisenbacteria bacterium]|nr:PEGA domain-containing protein [Candidatus Eisenbacteria bacterium]
CIRDRPLTDQILQDQVLTVQARRAGAPGADSLAVLRLTSTPPGAVVLVQGEARGSTPVSIPGLRPGRLAIEVRLAGYHPWSRDLYLEPGENEYPVELQPQSVTTASLSIDSEPPGAAISLDGAPTGRRTPAQLDGLTAGAHRVRLTASGLEPYETRVTVTAGSRGVVRGYLGPRSTPPPPVHLGGPKSYTISTRPYCSVYLDGNETVDRNSANLFVVTLQPGPHRFHLVNVEAGIDVNLFYEVKSDDPATSLILDADAARVIPKRK